MMLSGLARERVRERTRKLDAGFGLRLSTILSAPFETEELRKAAWDAAYCDWVVRVLDAVAPEWLAQVHVEDDLESALIDGPCKWARQRASDPRLLALAVNALDAAGRPLPEGQDPVFLVPHGAIQNAVRRRARYWADRADDYEADVAAEEDAELRPMPGGSSKRRVPNTKTAKEIARFISAASEYIGTPVPKKVFRQVAGYDSDNRTDFEQFQREDPKTTSEAKRKFKRVLDLTPQEFVEEARIKKFL